MDQQSIIVNLEKRAKLSGISINALCSRAGGLNPTTFRRWKKTKRNPNPTGAPILTVERLYKALAQMEREAERDRQKAMRQSERNTAAPLRKAVSA